ncbi:MAG: leucine-rich repeat domain-containing protein [Bacteroidales bacterium]|nr:leucine-rich repeat domain-containing protein [Bacteroidales bacterium]
MKKLYLFLTVLFAITAQLWAYDFSDVAPSGQTLYYNIVNGEAQVAEDNHVTGELTIPSTVTYNETTYTVTSIGANAFFGCSGLASVTIPNSVTSIGYGAFYGSSVNSVTISNSVTTIGDYAFCDCMRLNTVPIGNTVTSIGEYAFYNCSGFTGSLTIPSSVTNIGGGAFGHCTGLTSLTIPNSVTSIPYSAFSECSGLTSVTIPNSVTFIGTDAFYYCSNLTSVYYTGDIADWCNIEFGGVLSNPLRYAHNLYVDNSLVSSLVIPEGVTAIGDYAF